MDLFLRRFVVSSLLLFVFLAFSRDVFATTPIEESEGCYILSEVIASSEEQVQSIAELELVTKAKIAAFNYLKIHLNNPNIAPNDVDIDSLMLQFTPKKIERVGGIYNGYFSIVFDRESVNNLMIIETAKRSDKDSDNSIYLKVPISNTLETWVLFKNCFRSTNAVVNIIVFNKDFVHVSVAGLPMSEMESVAALCGCGFVVNNETLFVKNLNSYD